MSSLCRWGFLSTAAISRKNWKSIALSQQGQLTAVASRDQAKAQQFIEECMAEVPLASAPAALGDYDQLLQRTDVDVVYIALPTSLRKPWVLKAAQAGKHVLCEKPIADTTEDALEMIQACEAAGVQFMDGVMFNHSRRLPALKAELERPEGIGKIRRISSHFSFYGGPDFERDNIRVQSQLEPHGCLGDLGWYNIRFALWAMNDELPTSVVAHHHRLLKGANSPREVPGELSATLFFSGGVSAAFYCSFVTDNQQLAAISGEHGYITLDDFVLPFYGAELDWTVSKNVLEIQNCRWNMRRHAVRHAIHEYASGESNAQEVRMIDEMNRIVLSGKRNAYWPEIALSTQRVLDACHHSANQHGAVVQVRS